MTKERHKYSKVLFTNKGEGSLPQLVIAEDENMQSKFVVQKVLELREQGIQLEDIAVLFRSSFLSFSPGNRALKIQYPVSEIRRI